MWDPVSKIKPETPITETEVWGKTDQFGFIDQYIDDLELQYFLSAGQFDSRMSAVWDYGE